MPRRRGVASHPRPSQTAIRGSTSSASILRPETAAEDDDAAGDGGGVCVVRERQIQATVGVRPEVVPEYLGVDPRSQLARVLFESDYLGKQLPNRPDLEKKIPRYLTDFSYERAHPQEAGRFRPTATQHMWLELLLARLLHEKGDDAAAVAELREAQAPAPDHPLVRLLLAEALARAGDRAGAAAELRQYLALDPGNQAAAALLRQLEAPAREPAAGGGPLAAFPGVTSTYLDRLEPGGEAAATGAAADFDSATRWRPEPFRYRGLPPPPPISPKLAADERMQALLQRRQGLEADARALDAERAKLAEQQAAGQTTPEEVQRRTQELARRQERVQEEVQKTDKEMVDLSVSFEEEETAEEAGKTPRGDGSR